MSGSQQSNISLNLQVNLQDECQDRGPASGTSRHQMVQHYTMLGDLSEGPEAGDTFEYG